MENNYKILLKSKFLKLIQDEVANFNHSVTTDNGDWGSKRFY
jgi:hypothetical protein